MAKKPKTRTREGKLKSGADYRSTRSAKGKSTEVFSGPEKGGTTRKKRTVKGGTTTRTRIVSRKGSTFPQSITTKRTRGKVTKTDRMRSGKTPGGRNYHTQKKTTVRPGGRTRRSTKTQVTADNLGHTKASSLGGKTVKRGKYADLKSRGVSKGPTKKRGSK